ncbi:hypothetical protein CERSUDRAFT_125023 [Gelatoporia subvermispora B]|uniref:SMP domain-containing protein n=1 Tax=Ceriporiopsis subvermispora (strain B) TaxID=914234 RepID=M2R8K7_CERS8|nr:hypothetical protein CERSUDRAFT_125023 [Gelatoporia subvermispora B]
MTVHIRQCPQKVKDLSNRAVEARKPRLGAVHAERDNTLYEVWKGILKVDACLRDRWESSLTASEMSSASSSMTVVTSEVPLVTGDILRSINAPAVSPPASANGRSSSTIAEVSGLDLNAIGKAEARKIMSEEHKVLGFRPPHGSIAAEAQAAAAKHPEGSPNVSPPDPLALKQVAREDAQRILSEREGSAESETNMHAPRKPSASPPAHGVNLSTIGAAEARMLMSHEHRALGFRPPPGSLAAEAQAAAARHPDGDGTTVGENLLKEIAVRDAEKIKADRELNMVGEVNVSTLGKAGAERVISCEEHALGHRAPPGSLAAEARKAAAAHPDGGSFPVMNGDVARIEGAARAEADSLKAQAQDREQVIQAQVQRVERLKMQTGVPKTVRTETEDSVQIVGDVLLA